MDRPASLAGQLYLLAYDLDRRRLTSRGEIGYALRAAVLAELLLDGYVTDECGAPEPVRGRGRPADPVMAAMLARIGDSRPRSWKHWVRKGPAWQSGPVRRQLAEGRWIRVETRRVLGIVPRTRVEVREPRVVKRLKSEVAGALRGATPVGRVEPRTGVLVALGAAGELNHVVAKRQRRELKARIARLGVPAGPVPGALRKVVKEARSAAASV